MAKTLNSLGARDFLDEVYRAEGGYSRLVELLYIRKWPKKVVAEEYGISRNYLIQIAKKIEESPDELAATIKKIEEDRHAKA